MTTDNPAPKPEPEVALAMAYPDRRIRRMAQIGQQYRDALSNLAAIRAARASNSEES